jgi:coumaroylquinate(coumaroylshikimate) 3'-monooxygenase
METLTKWGKKYGPVFMFYIGKDPAVVLNTPEALHEVFVLNHDACNGREDFPLMKELRIDQGVIFATGALWENTRKVFSYTFMRNPEKKLLVLEQEIGMLCKRLRQDFENDSLGDVKIIQMLNFRFYSMYWRMICGGSEVDEGNEFHANLIMKGFAAVNDALTPECTAMNRIIGLQYLYPFTKGAKMLRTAFKEVEKEVYSIYDEHLSSFDENNQRDLMDNWICYQEQFNLSKENIVQIVVQILLGGVDTTVITACWVLMLVASRPDVQEQLQKEIEDVVGSSNGPPQKHQIEKLRYLNCVIKESMRFIPSAPLGLPRKAMRDIKLSSGLIIPKNALVIENLHSLSTDPKYWKDPHEFRPERFEKEEIGLKLKSTETRSDVQQHKFSIFGAGKRACPGFGLAIQSVDLIVSHLLWHFEWKLRRNDFSAEYGALYKPKHDGLLYPSQILRK